MKPLHSTKKNSKKQKALLLSYSKKTRDKGEPVCQNSIVGLESGRLL